MYTDTRDIAANAVNAGKAYENIVNAIDDAHDAAETAVRAAESAKMKVRPKFAILLHLLVTIEIVLPHQFLTKKWWKIGRNDQSLSANIENNLT